METDLFREALSALDDSPETRVVVEQLIARARAWPESAPEIPGTYARILRSLPYAAYPALSLVYRLQDDVVYLYHIERYDVLDGPSRDAG